MAAPTEPHPETNVTYTASGAGDHDQFTLPEATAPPPVIGLPAAAGEVGTLGPFRLVKELGKGGMGAVFAALDTRLDRRLALKVMLPKFAADAVAKGRFLREARAAARVKHDNVVTIYEADERSGIPYIAMEFLEGCPLDVYLNKKGPPTIPQVLRIAAETAAGLAAAHKIGLVHRDIKPSNLWLEAPNGRVKVLDFGLAKPVDGEVELTRSGVVVGTPAYMSPEQARGEKVDHRTDLFSLGAVLYRLCAGRLPFHGPTTMAVLMALGTEEPPPVRELNPSVPDTLAALIHQLLAKKPEARPQTADEVVTRLRGVGQKLAAPDSGSTYAQPQAIAPQVVFVPVPVPALPEQNPFADLDSPVTELTTGEASGQSAKAAEPKRNRPGGRMWVAAVLALALAAAAVAGVIIFRNKDGTETRTESPAGATVKDKDKGKDKDGKTLAQVGSGGTPPALAADPDRQAAKYVLSVGGIVQVNGERRDITAPTELPKDRFTLTYFNLDKNEQVTDAGLAVFKGCRELRELYLPFTQVTDAGLAHFQDCKELTHLWLDGTQVTDAGLAIFRDCKRLTFLSLACERVTDAGLAHFKDCKDLTHLSFGGAQVTDAGLTLFKDCEGLMGLHLDNTQVTDAGLALFKHRTRLAGLNLSGTQVTDTGLANFRDCKELAYLQLGDTQVTDAGLALFKDCKDLTSLGVQKTKVTAKGLEAFHATVPGCKIEHDGGVIEPKK